MEFAVDMKAGEIVILASEIIISMMLFLIPIVLFKYKSNL